MVIRRTLLLALLLVVGLAAPTQAAYSLVAHAGAASTNTTSVTTGSIDTSGANTLVCALASFENVSNPTISDSKSNTWHARTTYTPADANSVGKLTLYYAYNATVGSGHTFTANGGATANYPALACAAFSGGLTTDPYDQENGTAVNDGLTHTTAITNGVTPTEANELLVSGVALDSGINNWTSDNGFTRIENIAGGGGNAFSVSMAYKIETSIENPDGLTWSAGTGSVTNATGVATFKVGGASSVKLRGTLVGVGP